MQLAAGDGWDLPRYIACHTGGVEDKLADGHTRDMLHRGAKAWAEVKSYLDFGGRLTNLLYMLHQQYFYARKYITP